MREKILILGFIFLVAAILLFAGSYEIMQILYRANPTEWAGYDMPQTHDLLMLGGACFVASIILLIAGIVAIAYGVGDNQKSSSKQVLNKGKY
jgi:uncharacterized membrane protein